jgi:hypothetical protein
LKEDRVTQQIGSADLGFGNFKAATNRHVVAIPSVVGVGETDMGLLSAGLEVGHAQTRLKQPDIVAWDGVKYLVGERVSEFARPIERMDFQRLADGPELRALCYAAFARLLGPGFHQLALIVGLPVEVMSHQTLGPETLRSLRGWLQGHHEFQVNGQPIWLEITAIKAMAQPAGAFFAWGLNEAGEWIRPAVDLEVPVAICDIGYNTIDNFVVSKGNVVARYTGGDTQGMRRAAEVLIESVNRRYGRSLSLHEADSFLRNPRPFLPVPGGPVDLTPLIHQALDTMIGGALALLERHWGQGREFAHLLFAGGGPAHERVRHALLSQYPHGVILPQPVTANAIGLARYGRRVFGTVAPGGITAPNTTPLPVQ